MTRSWSLRVQMAVSIAVVAVLTLALLIYSDDDTRRVTAHFDRAVAVYPGTDLRVMGVQIGEVTSVVPDGNSVRVEMTYDQEYKLPADAKAAVVTPTLVADRYVQVFPAYGEGGAVLPDGGDIPLTRTQTPIELDRMFRALDDLSTTLGPKDGSTTGSLDNLLTASSKALEGNGQLGSETIRNLSAAADTFARNRGPLFDNVRALAELTDTLATNDSTVQAFLRHLTSVSGQLEGEREELRKMLDALADVLGTVKGFVHENRKVLGKDVRLLSSLLGRVDKEKDALGIVIQEGSLALGNLAIAFESKTGTYGSRVQVQPGLMFRPDHFLCQLLVVNAEAPESTCDIITKLFTPLLPPDKSGAQGAATSEPTVDPNAQAPTTPEQSSPKKKPDLFSLLGGGRR